MKIECNVRAETVLNRTGQLMDGSERLLRVLQGVLTLAQATGGANLGKAVTWTCFSRDAIFAVGIVRDVWSLRQEDDPDTLVSRQIASNIGWVLDGTTTLMFFEAWTPIKLGPVAPVIEGICQITWVSFFAVDAIALAHEQHHKGEGIANSPELYKTFADLSFAALSLWAPGTLGQGIAAIASGSIGLACVAVG